MDINDLNEDELKFAREIRFLKQLRKVEAPVNFEAGLMNKIQNPDLIKKESSWQNIFAPKKFIPSAALALSTVIILFVLNLNSDDAENPLLAEPKVREDIVEASSVSPEQFDLNLRKANPLDEKRVIIEEKKEVKKREIFADKSDTIGIRNEELPVNKVFSSENSSETGAVFSSEEINKSGLNFRHIKLSDEERAALYKLKQRVKTIMETGSR